MGQSREHELLEKCGWNGREDSSNHFPFKIDTLQPSRNSEFMYMFNLPDQKKNLSPKSSRINSRVEGHETNYGRICMNT